MSDSDPSPPVTPPPPSPAPAGLGDRGGAPPPPFHTRALRASGDFLRRVYHKADQDQIFFMAGAIAFNVLVAIIPLILAALGIAGIILKNRYGANPAEPLLRTVLSSLPPVSAQFAAQIQRVLSGLIEKAPGFIGFGTLIFIWLATRLVGTLRTALREIFDINQDRGIIAGKLFDIKMVIAAGTLLAVNVGLTITLELAARFGANVFSIRPGPLGIITQFWGSTVAFLSVWFMFLLIYRYLPARRIQWSTAFTSATFAAFLFELLKQAFSWYVANVANYRSTYNNLATLVIIFLWVYYVSIVFILAGEVGQVAALQRIRRRQKERLH